MVAERTFISVLIASKTAMVGELIAGALNRKSQFRVVASVTTAREVLETARTSVNIDVALVSATLADGPLSGFAALRHLRESAPDVKTILLLDIPEPNLVLDLPGRRQRHLLSFGVDIQGTLQVCGKYSRGTDLDKEQ